MSSIVTSEVGYPIQNVNAISWNHAVFTLFEYIRQILFLLITIYIPLIFIIVFRVLCLYDYENWRPSDIFVRLYSFVNFLKQFYQAVIKRYFYDNDKITSKVLELVKKRA
jgi:hypothetical protein